MRTILKSALLVTAGVVGLAAPSAAQTPPVMQTSGTINGLRLDVVRVPGGDFIATMAEDQQGLMWFGTRDQGVIVYDGAGYRQFLHDPLDPTSLSFNYVEEVFVDRQGTVWVGTYGGGLNRFNRDTKTFTVFKNVPGNATSLSEDHVSAMFEDREGNLWVGTRGGLDKMDRATGRFTHYAHDANNPNSVSENWIRAIFQDRQGNLWVGTQNQGLNKMDVARGTFTRFKHDPNNNNTLIAGMIGDIFEDSKGNLWVGTGRPTGGLNLVTDRQTGAVRRFRFDPASNNWPATASPTGPWTGGGVTSITEDRNGNLWFGIWEKGWLTRFNPTTGVATNYQTSTLAPAGSDAHPFALHTAKDGTLWVASIYGGPLLRVAPANLTR